MKKVDLLRKNNKDGNKTLIFDFHENKAYVEYFEIKGNRKEKSGYRYSYSNTFWLTLILMFMTTIMGLLLDKFIVINPFIGSGLSIIPMAVLTEVILKLLRNMIILKSKEEVSKSDIEELLKKSGKDYWICRMINLLLIFMIIIMIIISISDNRMSGKTFIMINLSVLVYRFMQGTIKPARVIKARRILKKQLREGKFDD